MATYRVVGVGARRDVTHGPNPELLYSRVFIGRTAGVFGVVDGIGCAVGESDHGMLPVSDMITKPPVEETDFTEWVRRKFGGNDRISPYMPPKLNE